MQVRLHIKVLMFGERLVLTDLYSLTVVGENFDIIDGDGNVANETLSFAIDSPSHKTIDKIEILAQSNGIKVYYFEQKFQ